MYGGRMVDDRPTLIYCRESRDENNEHYERIETQRDILVEFCKRRGFVNVVDIILDDDCTGTDFRRFDPIMERVKRKEVQVIVFKDASRLGRNLKESLNFRDLMEDYGAEIVFANEDYNDDVFPLMAWFNEQRAKEDSKKIRGVLRHKMESGTLLVRPAYGYQRGANNALVPRPETAEIVRLIFEKAQKGVGSNELATQLNALGVPTPSQAAGIRNAKSCWDSQHIRRIVTDTVYIGTMTHHKTSKKSFKNKKTVRHSRKEWIVLEDHHEPLVSKELFEAVQETRRKFKRVKYNKVNRPFSGLLRCGRCGKALVLRTRKNRPDAYICGKNHMEGAIKDEIRPDYGCRPHHIREEVLYEAVLRYLRLLLEQTDVDVQDIVRQLSEVRAVYDRVDALKKKLEQVQGTIDKMYDDKLAGLIHESLFARKYKELAALENDLQQQIKDSQKDLDRGQGARLTDLRLEDIINALETGTLTKEQLSMVFDRIVVFEPGEIQSADMWGLGLTKDNFELIWAKGGIVFVENMEPSVGVMVP